MANRHWGGSIKAHHGTLYLKVKNASGRWVERAPWPDRSMADTPENRIEAKRILAAVTSEHRARERVMGAPGGPITVGEWAKRWIADRRTAEIADADNDQSRLRLHVLPALGAMELQAVEPHHLKALALEWQAAGKASRTRRNIYSVVKAMFRDARLDGVLRGPDPCILTHRQLGKARDAVSGWRTQAVFSRDELEILISDQRIPEDRRVWYALLGIGMLRTGEAAGLRWRSVSLDVEPLGSMAVLTSYDDGTTKTETDRWVPIHPVLGAMLAEWKLSGWAREFGHPPKPDDLVCPTPKEAKRPGRICPVGSMRDRHWAWKRFRKDLNALGLRHRRMHDLRRTGISLVRSDGGARDVVAWCTHAPPRDVIDLYTSLEWSSMCREIGRLQLRLRRGEGEVVSLSGRTGGSVGGDKKGTKSATS